MLLRPWRVIEADVLRQLWTEHDPRVPPHRRTAAPPHRRTAAPPHRRIDADGRPTVADLEQWIRMNQPSPVGLLAVERKAAGDVIGYCGLTDTGRGSGEEPELAFRAATPVMGPRLRDRSFVGGAGLGEIVGV